MSSMSMIGLYNYLLCRFYAINIPCLGGAILIVLVAGYIARQYGLPPPPPKIAGVDLGTTFSSIGQFYLAYQLVFCRVIESVSLLKVFTTLSLVQRRLFEMI